MSSDPTLSSEELEATGMILRSTDRRFVDRISGDTLLILHGWCASGPDRKLWPDEDVRMKVIENGMLFEFQPNELCRGWESLKGTPEEAGLRLEGSKIDRFREFFRGSGLHGLRDFGDEQLRKFMIKYQDWLLPLLDEDEDEKEEFTSKIDGVIEFLSDKMKMKDTLVYMGSTATGNGFKGSLVFAYTKDDASPALLLLAHGVVSVDTHNYRYFPPARRIDTHASDSDADARSDFDSDADARSDFDSDAADDANTQESEEEDEENYICIGDPAHDVDPPKLAHNMDADADADNIDADADNDTIPYDPRWGPPMPPERMDPYVGSLVVTYVDSDVESNKEALDTEDIADMEFSKEAALDTYIADMESSKEAPGALYYIQATISSVDFAVDASKKRRVD